MNGPGYGWSRCAQFSLTVVSHVDEKYNVKKDTSHTFELRESDWGFTQFVGLSEIEDESKGRGVVQLNRQSTPRLDRIKPLTTNV